MCGRQKQTHFHRPCSPMFLTHICRVFAAIRYLSGLSDGMLPKASSGLGSGMGMMYSLYEVTTSCPSASCLRSPGLWLWLLAVGPGEEEKATGDREPNVGSATGKGEVRRGLVRATAGWSLFRKFSFTWLYLCFWKKCLLSRIMWQKLLSPSKVYSIFTYSSLLLRIVVK